MGVDWINDFVADQSVALKGKNVKLTYAERVLLVNQCRILEHLDPDCAEEYRRQRIAVENGYTLNYSDELSIICKEELPEKECNFVIDVLELHRYLQWSYKQLEDKGRLNEDRVRFRGFDGNNETQHLGYTTFLITKKGMWPELNRSGGFNSHYPTRERYQTMLDYFGAIDKKENKPLSIEEIRKITSVL